MAEQDPYEMLSSRSYLNTGQQQQQPTMGGSQAYKMLGSSTQQPEQSWFDVTAGAAEYGGAETLSNLAGYVGRWIPGEDWFDHISQSLHGFAQEHPEYAPTEVKGALDLMTNPKAISSMIFSGLPLLAAGIGAAAVNPVLAAGLIYGIENQRAYTNALNNGATDDEATTAGQISGVVNSALQLVAQGGVLNFAKGAGKQLAEKTIAETGKLAAAVGASGEAARFLGVQTLVGMLQGTANELVPLGVYGKPVDEGFVDRRLQDAIGAVATSSVYGLAGRQFNKAIGQDQATLRLDEGQAKTVDAYSRETLQKALVAKGHSEDQASAIANLTDARASLWSTQTGRPKEEYYATHKFGEIFEAPVEQQQPVEGAQPDQTKAQTAQSPSSDELLQSQKELLGLFGGEKTDSPKPGLSEKLPEAKPEEVKPPEAKAVDPIKEIQTTQDTLGKLFGIFMQDLSPEDQAKLQKLYPDGRKTDGATKMGGAFRRYLAEGNAPNTELIKTYDNFSNWLTDMYSTAKQAGGGSKLSPEARRIFDNLVYQDTPVVSQHRENVKVLKDRVDQMQSFVKKNPDYLTENDTSYQAELDSTKTELREAQRKLDRVKEAQFTPKQKSQGQALDEDFQSTQFKYELITDRKTRTRLQGLTDSVSQLISMASPVKRFNSGNEIVDGYNNIDGRVRQHVGKWEDRIVDTYSALTTDERQWLMKTDEYGQTNLRRAFDASAQNAIDPNQLSANIKSYGQLLADINTTMAGEANSAGVYQTRKDGSAVLFEQPEGQRVPRIVTADARAAISSKSGRMYHALVDYVLENNPGIKNWAQAAQALDNDFGEPSAKRSGSLEYVRKIANMPDVLNVDGSMQTIMHNELLELARKSLKYQAFRVERIREFGQGMIDTVEMPQLRRLGKILGVDTGVNGDMIRGVLAEQGVNPAILSNMSVKELRTLAKDKQLSLGIDKNTLMDQIMNISPNEIGKRGVKKLREFAKDLKGVDPDLDPIELTKAVKERLTQAADNKIDILTKRYEAEGGDMDYLRRYISAAEGLPFEWRGQSSQMGRDPIKRGMRFASDIIGGLQTSLAAIPNLPQVMVQVPQLAGMRNFLQALNNTFRDPMNTEAQVRALAGIPRSKMIDEAEPGYSLEHRGYQLKKLIGKVTLQEWIGEKNNIIAGEAFRLMAESWKNHGIENGDVQVARHLGLNGDEINQIRNKSMTDDTFAKIVQGGIDKTQFLTENPQNKGIIENMPIMRMLFAYSSYMLGTTRANFGLIKDIKESIASGDVKAIGSSAQRLSYLLVGSIGAGMTADILRQAIKGKSSDKPDDGFFDKALSALNDTAAFGVVHRFTDAYKYDGGNAEKFVFGLMPQLSAVTELMGTLAGYGKFGEFPIYERTGKFLEQHTPLERATVGWFDKVAYPDMANYDEAKSASSRFSRELKGDQKASNDAPLNPDYYNIFQRIRRGDTESAQEDAMSFFRETMKKGGDVKQAVEGLRGSLTARAPLDLSQINMAKFLTSTSSEERQRFIQAHAKYMSIVNMVAPTLGSR
jgi:hypothetical protein